MLTTLIRKIQSYLRGRQSPEPTKNEKLEAAKMSHTRLQALEGGGYRQCYMDKLRDVSQADCEGAKERWFDENGSPKEHPVEAEDRKRREERMRAQNRVSQIRLTALVATMTPEEAKKNEIEGKRLQGSAYQIPKLDETRS